MPLLTLRAIEQKSQPWAPMKDIVSWVFFHFRSVAQHFTLTTKVVNNAARCLWFLAAYISPVFLLKQRSRQPTLPPLCSRTLHHPSFLPIYMAARSHGAGCSSQTGESISPTSVSKLHPAVRPLWPLIVCPPVHPITPAEVFYTDPTMGRGRRIPNIVRQLRVSVCSAVNINKWLDTLYNHGI